MPPAPSRARNWNSPTARGSFAESASIPAPKTPARSHAEITRILREQWAHALIRRLVAIAHARLGQQVPRPGRVLLEFAAQPRHVEAQVVGLVLEARTPHPC